MSRHSGGAAGVPLCPSAPATAGAALIGIVQQDGHVANLATALPVDQAFLDVAAEHGPPEQRFRFASPCQKGGCTHWTGGACGLIGNILDEAEAHAPMPTRPPPCAIRAVCRWWEQEGPAACAVCTLVATDTRAEAAC
jgi:hypothetical protein